MATIRSFLALGALLIGTAAHAQSPDRYFVLSLHDNALVVLSRTTDSLEVSIRASGTTYHCRRTLAIARQWADSQATATVVTKEEGPSENAVCGVALRRVRDGNAAPVRYLEMINNATVISLSEWHFLVLLTTEEARTLAMLLKEATQQASAVSQIR